MSLLVEARPAEACSPPRCWAGFFTPAHATTVPANVPALHWRPAGSFDGSAADPTKVTLATAAGAPVAITVSPQPNGDFLLVPTEPLVPGTTYKLRDANACDGVAGPTSTFVAGPDAPLPTSLGNLGATAQGIAPLEVATVSGSCSSTIEADQVFVEVSLSAEAEPWIHLLHFETIADDAGWRPQQSIIAPLAPGNSWRGRGADLLYSTCASEDDGASQGLANGTYDVVLRATLPGAAVNSPRRRPPSRCRARRSHRRIASRGRTARARRTITGGAAPAVASGSGSARCSSGCSSAAVAAADLPLRSGEISPRTERPFMRWWVAARAG